MNVHITDFQTIEYKGNTAFVLVPIDLYKKKIRPILENDAVKQGIPHDIVRRNIVDSVPMIKAWREHLGITQLELAQLAGVTQPAIAKLERPDAKVRRTTLMKLAKAMGISIEQLEE